jgi:alpha-tubulin suppressor-like RCC1 family protein
VATTASSWFNRGSKQKKVKDKHLLNGTVDINDLNRKQLKANLEVRGLPVDGRKQDLRDRLMEAVKAREEEHQRHLAELEAARLAEIAKEESGSTYAVGINFAGQLGMGDQDPREVFAVIPTLKGRNADLVCAGTDYCFAVTEDSEVLAWGGGGHAPLGIEEETVDEDDYMAVIKQCDARPWLTPRVVERLRGEGIVTVHSKQQHVLARSEAGDVFTWGTGTRGELGLADMENRDTPQLLDALNGKYVTEAVTGHSFSAALTDDFTLFTWGSTHRGRLGLGVMKREGQDTKESFTFPAPTPVPSLKRIKVRQVACGASHCLAVANNNIGVYSWGCGDGGRLGHGDMKDRLEPTPVKALEGEVILQVAAGSWHSACIVIIPPQLEGGTVYTWGSGYTGQLGQGKATISLVPKVVLEMLKRCLFAKYISCGPTHNAVLTDDDQVYTWGSNKYGCLGAEIDVDMTPIPQKVWAFDVMMDGIGRGTPRSVTCGMEFTVVACYPYVGPTEEELIEEEEAAVKRAEEEALRRAEMEIAAATAKKKQEAEAKRIVAEMERAKRPLCELCTACPGFEPNLFKPDVCKHCNHAQEKHTKSPAEGDGGGAT